MEASVSGPSKRTIKRTITQVANCLVDGCNADLRQCRYYYRRHKVCELHSKTSRVRVGGREQRFCQQCSRFHSLVEFDEGKRSCRKRLDGHNRRRRKPRPELSTHPGLLSSGEGGMTLLSFSTVPQEFPPAGVSSSWAGNHVVSYNDQAKLNLVNTFPESSSVDAYKGVDQFHFIQNANHTFPESLVCQPLLETNFRCERTNSGKKIFSDGLNQVNHSDRALSPLSPTTTPAVTTNGGVSPIFQPEVILQAQSMVHNLPYGASGQFQFALERENKSEVAEAEFQVGNDVTLQFPEMFQTGLGGSSTSESQQTLASIWK